MDIVQIILIKIINDNMTTRCEGIKKDGNQCSRNVKSGKYCYQHIPVDSTESKSETESKPKREAEKRCCCCSTKVDLHMKSDKYYCSWHYPSTCYKCNKDYTIFESVSGGCPRCIPVPEERPCILSSYKILEIEVGSTKKEIRSAYLKLSLKWHPDKCDLPEAKTKFQEIKDAYESVYNI